MNASSDLFVRAATEADRDAIHWFLTRAAQDETIDRFDVFGYAQDFVLPMAQIHAGQLFVAGRAGAMVGLASLVFRHDGDVEIDGLLIDPSVDRHDTGGSLVLRCKEFARGASARALYATVRGEAERVLFGWGFETLGVDEGIMGSVALKMRMAV